MSQKAAQTLIWEDVNTIIQEVGVKTLRVLSGKKFLVTGPNGLLASYIVDTIAMLNRHYFPYRHPCHVLGLSRSHITASSRLGHLLDREDITLCIWNVRNPLHLVQNNDFILHAAGRSAPSFFTQDPVGTVEVNVDALSWLLSEAAVAGPTRVGYFSSGEIYGNPPPEAIPTPETYCGNTMTNGPRGSYTEAKRCGEALCFAYHRQFQLPTIVFRPFVVYGPGLDARTDKRVMAEFIRQGLTGQPIALRDEGQTLRSYCYITDAMIMFWKIFLSSIAGDVFNLGNGHEERSILDVAKMVHTLADICQPPLIMPTYDPALQGAPHRVCPDMTKMTEAIGYTARVPLAEGLDRTYQWNRELANHSECFLQ